MRCAAGAGVRMLDGRPETDGRVAEIVRSEDGSDAVDGSLLDRGIRRSGTGGAECMAEQCARHKKSTRAQERCAGEPVAHEVAYVWIVAELVPTAGRDTGSAANVSSPKSKLASVCPVMISGVISMRADER